MVVFYESKISSLSAPQEIDEYDDLVGPIDILKPLEKSGFWEAVVSGLSLSFTYNKYSRNSLM